MLKEEFVGISKEVVRLEKNIELFTENIDKGVSIEIVDIIKKINIQNDKRSIALGAIYKFELLEKYKREKERLENFLPISNKDSYEHITTSSLTELSNDIKTVLKGYNYPNLTDVSYSEELNDFVISGENRNLSGKGYRAIIYSAFIIGLHE